MRRSLWTQQRCCLLQAPMLKSAAELTMTCFCRARDCSMAGTEACMHCEQLRRRLYRRLSQRPQQWPHPGPQQILSMMQSLSGQALVA